MSDDLVALSQALALARSKGSPADIASAAATLATAAAASANGLAKGFPAVPATAFQSLFAAGNALHPQLPVQSPPANTAPLSIVLATTNPAGTPTQIKGYTSGAINRTNYAFSGGYYIQPSPATNLKDQACIQQTPNGTMGFGSAFVDCLCDSPLVTIQHWRSQAATTRVLVDVFDGRGMQELFRVVAGIRANTAQAGAAGTITLDAAASAVDNFYTGNWIHTTGGTGPGQYRMCTAYNGTTKVATVVPDWTVNPDNTTTFEITDTKAQFSNLTNTGASANYLTTDWNSERRLRHYRIEHGNQGFAGLFVPSVAATVIPAVRNTGPVVIGVGDSFFQGTGTDIGRGGSVIAFAAASMGAQMINLGVGGTGDLNPGSGATVSFNAQDRLFPAYNSWFLQLGGATGGTFTVTWNGVTTGTIAFNASSATAQTAMDTAFGTGAFAIVVGGSGAQHNVWIVGSASVGASQLAMTADFSALSGTTGTATIVRWVGDLALHAPRDATGAALPFMFIEAMGHNDTADSNAAYTPTAIQTALEFILTNVQALYPASWCWVVGNMYLPGSPVPANVPICSAARLAAATSKLPKVNNIVPFIDCLGGIVTGTGKISGTVALPTSQTGDGNSDWWTLGDSVHPTSQWGHPGLGKYIARTIQKAVGS